MENIEWQLPAIMDLSLELSDEDADGESVIYTKKRDDMWELDW